MGGRMYENVQGRLCNNVVHFPINVRKQIQLVFIILVPCYKITLVNNIPYLCLVYLVRLQQICLSISAHYLLLVGNEANRV